MFKDTLTFFFTFRLVISDWVSSKVPKGTRNIFVHSYASDYFFFFLYSSHFFDILTLHIHYFWLSSNYLLLNSVSFFQYFHVVLIITMCFLLFLICLGQQGRYFPTPVDISWFYSVNLYSNKNKSFFLYPYNTGKWQCSLCNGYRCSNWDWRAEFNFQPKHLRLISHKYNEKNRTSSLHLNS